MRWSADVGAAAWIGPRLAPFGSGVVTSVVPGGFPAYAELPGPDGALPAAPAAAVAGVLARHTATPADCWFAVWDGYGWGGGYVLSRAEADATRSAPPDPAAVPAVYTGPPQGTWVPNPADPVPAAVRAGPRVRLPNRDYLLYRGPAADVLGLFGATRQTPNLWWPADRAWCVATELDLDRTYVGGSPAAVADLCADRHLAARSVRADDPTG